jgi:hypothetical protein
LIYCADHYEQTEDANAKRISGVFEGLGGEGQRVHEEWARSRTRS